MLLRRGSQILSDLFPGLLEDLLADGVPVWNDGDLSKLDLSFRGHQLVRCGRFADLSSTTLYSPSRPLLEFHVRQRILALANVTLLQRRDVLELDEHGRKGPHYRRPDGGPPNWRAGAPRGGSGR